MAKVRGRHCRLLAAALAAAPPGAWRVHEVGEELRSGLRPGGLPGRRRCRAHRRVTRRQERARLRRVRFQPSARETVVKKPGRGRIRQDRSADYGGSDPKGAGGARGAGEQPVSRPLPVDPSRLGAGLLPGVLGVRRARGTATATVQGPLALHLHGQRRSPGQPGVRPHARQSAQGARTAIHAALHAKIHGPPAAHAGRCREPASTATTSSSCSRTRTCPRCCWKPARSSTGRRNC